MLPLLAAGTLAPMLRPAEAAAGDSLSERLRHPPIICAHRARLRPDVAENSLASMGPTADARFMLEVDLAALKDGTLVLMHDTTLDRATDGHGRVADLAEPELARVHLRAGSQPTAETPPHYDAFLRWAKTVPSALLMLDIKRVSPERAMEGVRRFGLTDRVLLLTFDPQTAAAAFEADPTVAVSVLVRDEAELARYRAMAKTRHFAAYVPRDSGAALMQAAHEDGAFVVTDLLNSRDALVDTVDPHAVLKQPPTAAEYAALLRALPADIVVTNDPLALRAALRRRTG
jgi:glycerophosphoryl diester phosphodiesterase